MLGEGDRPCPYNPENAYLEAMSQTELWPQNLYEAQLKAYRDGRMTGMPSPSVQY